MAHVEQQQEQISPNHIRQVFDDKYYFSAQCTYTSTYLSLLKYRDSLLNFTSDYSGEYQHAWSRNLFTSIWYCVETICRKQSQMWVSLLQGIPCCPLLSFSPSSLLPSPSMPFEAVSSCEFSTSSLKRKKIHSVSFPREISNMSRDIGCTAEDWYAVMCKFDP